MERSVDSATEATMQGIIDTEFKECTVLAIMHRLDHSERYDRVVVMEDGAVVEVGEPRTLATTDSRFARMLKSRTWLDSPSNQT
jgi:ABC-type multidrug transport system fused ATPase/permease subunit